MCVCVCVCVSLCENVVACGYYNFEIACVSSLISENLCVPHGNRTRNHLIAGSNYKSVRIINIQYLVKTKIEHNILKIET